MSYNNFGRGRGYGPSQGTRAARRFGRPRFPRPPYRHAAPPRPGPLGPPPYGVPWQPSNMFFHPLRGNPRLRPDGRRRRYCYDVRQLNRLPTLLDCQVTAADIEQQTIPQLPLLGSEEERQQKITETADRLKQKLSSLSCDETTDVWQEDAPSGALEDDTESRRVSLVGYKSSEISLTYNDLKDIGKITPNHAELDRTQYVTDDFDIADNADNNVILNENDDDGPHVAMPSEQMTNLENAPDDNEYVEQLDSWGLQEPVDNCYSFVPDLHGDTNIEDELLDPDLQHQYGPPPADIPQAQDDTSQDIEMQPAFVEQNEFEMPNLQDTSFPVDSAGQDTLQDALPSEEYLATNLDAQEGVLNSHAKCSNGSMELLTQPGLDDMPVNNVALDSHLPAMNENVFRSDPPSLSPQEEKLPDDFDPTTPPPILLKQEQPRILPPYSMPSDLPPLYDPTAPPPNIKCFLGSHEDANAAWSNAQNPMSASYQNVDVHVGLNAHGGFVPQQLLPEISSPGNGFVPPHIDSVRFSPVFPMPPGGYSEIGTHVPPELPQMHAAPHNIYVSPSSLPELSPPPDLHCSANKDDGLTDMQEAMEFAKEMTNITGKTDEESRSNPVGNVEFIALPPGKPKPKPVKLRRTKGDERSRKKTAPEEQSAADRLLSDETTQDANVKSKDVSVMQEQDRPKVTFNLNNKTKIVNTKAAWQESNEKKNGMMAQSVTQSVELSKTHVPPAKTKTFERTLKHSKEEKIFKRHENNENVALAELIANQGATLPHKKPQKNVYEEKSQHSSVLPKVNVQTLRNRLEKNENPDMETSWKNKIVSRFLKMSKNDIYNMVNNTSLRKFDIIMKRLVKEKKSTLSLEMRQAQDEKMKSYDQQEFMNQLNAMLDTDAIVSITDLPTEFIHHLNEVLQLDVQPDNHAESAVASSSQCDNSEDAKLTFSPVIQAAEGATNTLATDVSQECVRKKSHATRTTYKDVQAYNTNSNDLDLRDDNAIATDDANVSSNPDLLVVTLQHDLDNIFSEVTKKNQKPKALKERKRCRMEQQNARRFDVDLISRSVENEGFLIDDRAYRLENYPHWDDRCDRWKRKEREDPHAYRNLTKEEWEARYGTQADLTPVNSIPSASTQLTPFVNTNLTPFINMKLTPSVSTRRIGNKKLPNRGHGKKCYPRRRHSSESSRHPSSTRHRSLEKDKHKRSRRHSDDRRHTRTDIMEQIEYLEPNINPDSNSSSSSTSSSSTSSSTSTSTSSNDNTNVTKLLRVIKENEKVAKKMTLNEAIRDEVNAEIERERKSKKSRKNRKSSKSRKHRKAHKKKRKQNKKTTSSCDSSSEDDEDDEEANEEETDRLLTENEIKKEIENQITQEVIVKEELDIGQEEDTGEAEFVSPSNLMIVRLEENKAAYLPPATQNRLESPSSQEIPLIPSATQLHAEDRLPTASPTQLKTKAQLKQMPETSDMNDNKVPLNVFTCIPEDWRKLNPNFLECTENLNEPCQTFDVGCSQDKAVLLTSDSFTGQQIKTNNNAALVSPGEANKSAIPQQLDATVCNSTETSSKIQDDSNEMSVDKDISKVATSASSASSVPSTSAVTQKQGTSKKIDIKTYYERTIQRRMSKKLETKKPTENPAISTQNSPIPKTTEPEIAVNKPALIPAYSGSIQDPRIAARLAAAIPSATSGKDDIAPTAIGKNTQQKEKQTAKGSTIAELAPRRPEENLNRIVKSDNVVEKMNQDKSKNKPSLAANSINILSDVIITPKITLSKSKKGVKENATDKLQSKVPADPKRFKNIRSEGSKELKLKKEMAKEQKAKKKAAAASASLVSKKVHGPLKEATRTEKVTQEKKINNIGDINKTEIERIQSSPRENKINNNDAKTEPTIISSGNADNNDNELPHDNAKAKELPNLEIHERENAEKAASNIEHSSKATRNEEKTRGIKRKKNASRVEIADKKIAREIGDVAPKLDVPTTSRIVLGVPEISNKMEKMNKENFSTLTEIQQSDTAKDTELSLNYADQIEKSNSQSESAIKRDTNELDETPRLDSIDKEDNCKEDQLLIAINSNIETNNTKESNMELDVLNEKSASANEDASLDKKTAKPSSASNENSLERQSAGNGDVSPESIGSPFKGFLPEAIMDFEQPNLFSLNEIDANKKMFLSDCNVNYVTAGKNTKIEGPQDYGTLVSGTDYTNDANINVNENFNIAFGDTLLASDKEECATSEKSDKSDLMATDESREGHVTKSTSVITAPLQDEDNDINIGSGREVERQLLTKDGRYASCLAMKESMFINEEEIIQSEARAKDLTSKLKTTTDPSLSDALEATISDDALRLPESQSAENLDLEANICVEKAPCDKLPDFDSNEHLDNDIFYLDDRLQSATTFDNKDDESDFPVHRQSPRYDVTPPETTIIVPDAGLSRGEISKPQEYDLKNVSSTDNDLLGSGSSTERSSTDSPRTLNVPTKAALKEATASHFLKPPSNVPTAIGKEVALEMLDKTQRDEASYQASDWRVEKNARNPLEADNANLAQDFTNVNTISSTQNDTCDGPSYKDTDVERNSARTPSISENRLHKNTQHNPVVQLRKMKELDKLLEARRQGNSEKVKKNRGGQKKRNGTILHKLKDQRRMKYQSKRTSRRNSLTKRLKKMKRARTFATREAIQARMLEIDIEMHKLASEKLKLHEMLQNNFPLAENSPTNSGATPRTGVNDPTSGQPETPSAQNVAQDVETSREKQSPSSRPSAKKRVLPRSSEDDEIVSYMQRSKTPVIRWKKKPRLEEVVRREEEEDLDEATEQQASTSAKKKAESSSTDASEDIQKAELNAARDDEAREEEAAEKPDEETPGDVDFTATCKSAAADKSAGGEAKWQEVETERAQSLDDEPNDAARASSQPSSRQVHPVVEALSIYTDDSTWDSLVQNTASEMHERQKATGLVLLDESLKKELARSRKMEAIVRKKKKEQLDNFLRTVNNLTTEEEELPLSKLYIKKLRQKRDLLDSLSQKKDDTDLAGTPDVLRNVDDVINAVAEDRVDLYEPQSEARASGDMSNASPVPQSDKHQFYVDAEANANSDWPCRVKENVEEVALQQDSDDDVPGTDGSNHVFKAVTQDKIPFYEEHNVEPDSSITPEGTLMEGHSSDCERDSKDSNNVTSRNFDIKVSVPKVLIKDDFSPGVLQKFKNTEGGVVGSGLVDSTTNAFSERPEEKDKSSQNTSQIVKEESKGKENVTKDKHAVNADEREETIDSATNTPSAPQSATAKSGSSAATENEESGDSNASNRYDKTAIRDVGRDSSASDFTAEKTDTKQKKLDAESKQLSNDAIDLKKDLHCQSMENAAAKEEEKNNPENKSRTFEKILDNEQIPGSSVPADLVNEKSEESNEASVEQKSSLERTLTSTFNKATAKGGETSKKLRRKQADSIPIRRSTRNSNENAKLKSDVDATSSSSERSSRETSILHERDIVSPTRSKSPTWTTLDEKIANNIRMNRIAQKGKNASNRKVSESEAKISDLVKRLETVAKKRKQSAASPEWQVKNCKVRLVDCKPVLLKYVKPNVLESLGIVAVNPFAPSDSSCMQPPHVTCNQNIAIMSTVDLNKNSSLPDKPCDKVKPEVEILEEKSVKKSDKDLVQESNSHAAESNKSTKESGRMQYTVHKGPILDIKVFQNSFLAASEDSKIYRYSQISNGILNIYKGHKSAVTCLYIYKSDIAGVNKELMYSGSLDGTLRCYDIMTGAWVMDPALVNSPIQCMDQSWGMIFIGTKSGCVSRFHIKAGIIKGESIQFSDESVLALKATNEGPRKILIVASRNQPISIRDAQTGLFLRTISGQKNLTVYSLLRHENLIYCGTKSTSINVFDFTTGEQAIQYDAGVGIVCLRLYKRLLFAGCYNGYIYVFDTNNHKLVCSIRGPGNMLLSIEVVNNKIIAGSKDRHLHIWQVPAQVRALL